MSIAKRVPLLGIVAGIALMIIGFNYSKTDLIIIGLVLIAIAIFRQVRG